MCRSPSPPAKRSIHVRGKRAKVGVMTHVSVDVSKLPSPLDFFDQTFSAVCHRRTYQTTRGPHFLLGALSTRPKNVLSCAQQHYNAVLIVMGSCGRSDYVAHLGLMISSRSDCPVRIKRAWAQSICAMPFTFLDSVVEDDGPSSPLAKFVHDITGRRLHLACALTHCNMNPPSTTRAPPMLRLGGMANKIDLEDAVFVSRVQRQAAITIQRAFRNSPRPKRSRQHMGARMLSNMLTDLRIEGSR